MKTVIVIGASGTIGTAVADDLATDHTVIRVGRSHGDFHLDYSDPDAVADLYRQVGDFDAVAVAVGGDSAFVPLDKLDREAFMVGINRKLLAQANIVLAGLAHVTPSGSFTLTSGFLSHYPNTHSIITGTMNAAIDAFALHVAPSLPAGIRVNTVSPAQLVEGDQALGNGRVNPKQVANAFRQAITGTANGTTIRIWNLEP